MNVKPIAVIAIGVILIVIGVGIGGYYAGSKAGYEEAQKEYSIQVAEAVEQARLEQERINAEHLHRVAEFEEAKRDSQRTVQSLQERLRLIASSDTNEANQCLCDIANPDNGAVVGLLNEAISNPALSETTDQPFIAEEKESTTAYMLHSIQSYNECAIQLNALIESIE